jgi:hypothetical protein
VKTSVSRPIALSLKFLWVAEKNSLSNLRNLHSPLVYEIAYSVDFLMLLCEEILEIAHQIKIRIEQNLGESSGELDHRIHCILDNFGI